MDPSLPESLLLREQMLRDAIDRMQLSLTVLAIIIALAGVAASIGLAETARRAARRATEAYLSQDGQRLIRELAEEELVRIRAHAAETIAQIKSTSRRRQGE